MINESLLIEIGLEQEYNVLLSHLNLLNLSRTYKSPLLPLLHRCFLLVSDMLTAQLPFAKISKQKKIIEVKCVDILCIFYLLLMNSENNVLNLHFFFTSH